jgi:hypothetical protein
MHVKNCKPGSHMQIPEVSESGFYILIAVIGVVVVVLYFFNKKTCKS